MTKIEKAKALKKASGFKSKNPHFMVIMQLSFVKAWYLVSFQFRLSMHKHNVVKVLLVYSTNEYNAIYLVQCIPVGFTQKKYIQSSQHVMLKVEDQSWKVLFSIAAEKRPDSFSSGLSTFAKENGLQVGDICVFELIKGNNNSIVVLEVLIFRD